MRQYKLEKEQAPDTPRTTWSGNCARPRGFDINLTSEFHMYIVYDPLMILW